jgi:hypothetical protein
MKTDPEGWKAELEGLLKLLVVPGIARIEKRGNHDHVRWQGCVVNATPLQRTSDRGPSFVHITCNNFWRWIDEFGIGSVSRSRLLVQTIEKQVGEQRKSIAMTRCGALICTILGFFKAR